MESIAIIGISCLFPGSQNPDQFYRSLLNHETFLENDFLYSIDPDQFDVPVDKKHLERLDEIYTYTLYVVHEALKDSGYLKNNPVLEKTGLIVGNRETVNHKTFEIFKPLYLNELEKNIRQLLNQPDFRFNYTFDTPNVSPLNVFHFNYPTLFAAKTLELGGPAFAIEAACASSLYSIKLASSYLLSGQVDLMVAGGMFFGKRNKALPYFLDQLGVTPKGGDSRPFDKNSGGMIANEGGGAVVLKRLSDAIQDQDTIYGVIESIGWSNDGAGKYILAPSRKGQTLAYQNAYDRSPSKDIDYIECHATGTQIGDLVELNSLEDFYGQNKSTPLLGALKGNIGHLLTASGMAGVIKILCSMKHGTIPATVNVTSPLSSVNGIFSGDGMVLDNIPWPNNNQCKRAAINAFGFGGINGHMLIKEYIPENNSDVSQSYKKETLPEINLCITGLGLHYGDIKTKKQFTDALFFGRHPTGQNHPGRLRGIEKNKSLLNNFLSDPEFPADYNFSEFDFDYLKNKVHNQEETEALNKELLMLNVANKALEDAGFKKGRPRNVAVIISAKQNLFQLHFYLNAYLPDFIRDALKKSNIDLSESQIKQLVAISKNAIIKENAGFDFIATGIGPIIATRIASTWDFTGPVFKLCDLENSFIRSVELAHMLLQNNSVDAVLLGSIDGDPLLESRVWQNKFGKKYGLDLQAMKMAEGAAAVVVKNRSSITEHTPHIYANIDSIKLLREKSSSRPALSYPSGEKFLEGYRQSMKQAKTTPDRIGYLELSGNLVNAPLKNYLKRIDGYLGPATVQPIPCGSSFFNFGYSFMTSQAISLLKTVLMLNYGFLPLLPKSVKHFPIDKFYHLKFPETSSYWIDTVKKKKACVSSTGFDGSHSHLILSGNDRKTEKNSFTLYDDDPVLVIGGKDQQHLKENLNVLKETLPEERSLFNLVQNTNQLFKHKNALEKKYTIVLKGHSQKDLKLEIDKAIDETGEVFKNKGEWKGTHGSYFTAAPKGEKGKVAVVYPPSGFNSPFALYEIISSFPQLVPYLHELLEKAHPKTLDHLRNINTDLERKDQLPLYMDGILGNLLSHLLLEGLAISPDVFLGCSFGELVMYSTTGILIEKDETDFISDLVAPLITKLSDAAYIKEFFRNENINWVTYFCKGQPRNITGLINDIKDSDSVFMTIKGSPKHVIISGHQADCERFFKKADCFAYQISRDIVVHTPLAMTFYDEIVKNNFEHPFRILKKNDRTYYSTYTKSPFNFQKKEFAYTMADCICRPIDFEALILKAYQDGVRTFIGMDTSNILTNWLMDTLEGKDALILPIKQNNQNYCKSLETCRTRLISHRLGSDMRLFSDRPMEKRPTRSLIKTISNAPDSISESMLTEANKNIFQPQKHTIHNQEKIHPEKKTEKIEIPSGKNKDESLPDKVPAAAPRKTSNVRVDYMQKIFDQNARMHQSFFNVQNDLMHILEHSVQKTPSIAPRTGTEILPFKKINRSHTQPSKKVIWNEEEIKEMTLGQLSNILGPQYAEADNYATRARMPLPPFMFVSRVTDLEAEFGKLKPSMIEIEYDIPEDAWFEMNGKIPFSIINESSHCGILLLSYMGVDILFKGRLHYRAIDSSVTVHSEKMLQTGETVIGRFRIKSFIKTKELMLAIFNYDLFDADHTHIFTIKGTGGFFSKEELKKASGVIHSKPEIHKGNTVKKNFSPILSCDKKSFSREDIVNLQNGRADLCFGSAYPIYDRGEQLYPEKFKILDRVPIVDVKGGPFGLGFISGEADIDPDYWIFDAHFKDDPVLPATVMIEGGIQLLSFFVHFVGLKKISGPESDYNTVSGSESQSKFRGEVKREKTTLRYECTIKEITPTPEVGIIADLDVFNRERLVAQSRNMSMKLKKQDKDNGTFFLAI